MVDVFLHGYARYGTLPLEGRILMTVVGDMHMHISSRWIFPTPINQSCSSTSIMKNHLDPQPSTMVERYNFRQRRPEGTESVAEYAVHSFHYNLHSSVPFPVKGQPSSSHGTRRPRGQERKFASYGNAPCYSWGFLELCKMISTNLIKTSIFLLLAYTTVYGSDLKANVLPKSMGNFNPNFTGTIENITVPVSRDARFQCTVNRLGGYRVGWVKADTKAIQAIHDHVITHNPRVSVSHLDHQTWRLHIKNVQVEDMGQYMCQINTNPMKSQTGMLTVVVPPDFIFEETSGDVDVPEGGTVKLTCKAKGMPDPHVLWRREDGEQIVVRDHTGGSYRTKDYQGEVLRIPKITRLEMGAYMCIASNGVPPAISKRVIVNVNFIPVIQVPNQLVGAPLGTDVTLQCYVEASPRSINYWMRDPDEMVISSQKYDVQMVPKSLFGTKMSVTIKNLQKEDVGTYRCLAKNSLGEVENNVRLYEIPGSATKYSSYDEEDYGDQTGSAEGEHNGRQSNSVADRGKIVIVNTGTSRKTQSFRGNVVPTDVSNAAASVLLAQVTVAMSQGVLLYVTLAI